MIGDTQIYTDSMRSHEPKIWKGTHKQRVSWFHNIQTKFWEELIAFFRLITCGLYRKPKTKGGGGTRRQQGDLIRLLTKIRWEDMSRDRADHSGRRAVWGMNCLRPLKHWECGFESHLRHGCMCAFFLCLCCPVCAGNWLATSWFLIQGVLQTV
jgi:hypothetical protein